MTEPDRPEPLTQSSIWEGPIVDEGTRIAVRLSEQLDYIARLLETIESHQEYYQP